MQAPDEFVVTLDYVDQKGKMTRRVVSPIRTVRNNAFLGLCLCRADVRQFRFDRCSNLVLTPAHEVVMPVEMIPAG